MALRTFVQKKVVVFALVLLGTFGVAGSLLTTAAEAQNNQSNGQSQNEGFNDWGLFGLLGLAGLAGLRRNRTEHDNRDYRRERDVEPRGGASTR